jgi:hypothetical protein
VLKNQNQNQNQIFYLPLLSVTKAVEGIFGKQNEECAKYHQQGLYVH